MEQNLDPNNFNSREEWNAAIFGSVEPSTPTVAPPTIREIYEQSEAAKKFEMDRQWVFSGGHLADAEKEAAILRNVTFEQWMAR